VRNGENSVKSGLCAALCLGTLCAGFKAGFKRVSHRLAINSHCFSPLFLTFLTLFSMVYEPFLHHRSPPVLKVATLFNDRMAGGERTVCAEVLTIGIYWE